MTRVSGTTRIGVRRIVIEVNRDLTVEQFEMLDETLKKLGLVKTTKVTLHDDQPHKTRIQRPPHPKPSDHGPLDLVHGTNAATAAQSIK